MYVARGTMIQIGEDINIDLKRFENTEALIIELSKSDSNNIVYNG